MPLSELAELVNIGTLFAFILGPSAPWCCGASAPTCSGRSDAQASPVVPILAILTSFYLMLNLPAATDPHYSLEAPPCARQRGWLPWRRVGSADR